MEKKLYSYNGSVVEFERVIETNWKGKTMAATPAKARSNLTYQYKMQTGRLATSKIHLPDKLQEVV